MFIPDYSKCLSINFYRRDTVSVAKDLLGKVLVKKLKSNNNFNETFLAGRIVETEAYLPIIDEASHSYPGPTKRNQAMFADGGILYVYLIYGVHNCINIVTETGGIGSAVLIRALEPLSGIEIMKVNRHTDKISNLCKGPGNVAKAFDFSLKDNYHSLISEDLFIQDSFPENFKIMTTTRIGISKSSEFPLRFYIDGSNFVSVTKKIIEQK